MGRPITHKCRLGAGPAALTVALITAAAAILPAASAADPVSSGTFELKLSRAFHRQMHRNGLVMRPMSFRLKAGEVDPMNGTGALALSGKLRFRHGHRKVVYRKVTASLGPGGRLKGNGRKLFRLSGGTVTRNGFGAEVSGVRAAFVRSAARRLRRRLDLDSLHRGRAGVLAVSVQPQTVEVTGGSVRVVPDPDTGAAANVTAKLDSHCIDFVAGNTAIAPGVKGGSASNPYFDFPVAGGTISPDGAGGVIQGAGGIGLHNTTSISGCGSAALASIQQTDIAFDLSRRLESAHVVVSGSVPTAGDYGVGFGANLDPSNATVSTDPANHTVTIHGIVIRINGATALIVNQTFLQPLASFDNAKELVSGDLFGTLSLTVTTR